MYDHRQMVLAYPHARFRALARIAAACLALALRGTVAVGAPEPALSSSNGLAFETQVHAQSQPAPATTLKVYSRETVVDVNVTDSKGNPVHGLKKEDFTVKEDGKPQPIHSFEEFGTKPVQSPPRLPPNVYTNLQPPASGAVNIFLVDFLNIAAMPSIDILGAADAYARAIAAQNAVKSEAKKYVASMPPGTRVIVLGLSNNLRTLQGLTSDPALLSASIDTLDYNAEGRVSTYGQYCIQAGVRTRMTLEALNQIAADASTIKGKKNLLWFSVGMPWITDPAARAECLPSYTSDLLKTYGLFNAAQIAVYPIDARGVATMPNAFITSKGQLFHETPNGPWPSGDALAAFMEMTAEQHLAMESWAEATGGAAYYNSNDIAGLITKAVDTGSGYYTITYNPPGQKYNWAHHNIKVSVDQPNLHLIYRKTYDAVDPATIKPAPGLTLAAPVSTVDPGSSVIDMRLAMGRAMPASTDILFDVKVEPSTEPTKPTDPPIFGILDPKLKDKPLTRYGFEYLVPARQLAFATTPEGNRKASLEFDLAAYDAQGKLINSLSQTIKPVITAAQHQQLMKGPFRFFQQLDLPAGALFLRIGVLDANSDKAGTIEIPVTVPRK